MDQDMHAYLETEARIIAEDDVHAAIVVRVKKDWLARNMLFLAALADLTSAPVKRD
jgi:hypothetical protein